ncbi:MAG: hypothetical protein R3A79_02320 [Nannocystaceae bacterium]
MRTPFSLSSLTSALLLAGVLGGCVVVTGNTDSDTATDSSSSTSDSDTSSSSSTQGTVTVTDGMTTSTSTSTTTVSSTTDATEGTDSSTSDTTGETTGGPVSCDDGCGSDYCDWNANSCGILRADQGTCETPPDGCDDVYMPVCGCDGQVHGNECEAHGAGTDVAAANGCEAPEGYFECGFMFCDAATTYCQIVPNDVVGEPDFYQCNPLPDACGKELVCGCLAEEECYENGCVEGDLGLTITCLGG